MIRIASTLLVLSFALSGLASADVTIRQTTNGKGLVFSGKAMGVTYIKGNKMRTDLVDGDKTLTTVFDLDAQKMIAFDSNKKEADVWDMAVISKELAKSVDTSKMKVSLTPTGQSKEIAGQKATGYMLEVSMPAAMGGSPDLAMIVTLSGPTWIVKGAPGTADYLHFYKSASEKGWILSDPNAAKASPGPARAMTEMYRQLAEAGGIAYETDIQIKMGVAPTTSGSGNPLGGLMARMGSASMASTVTAVETSALSDDLFAPPAGYKLKDRK